MRQRDLAEVQHHLQVDLLKCSHSCEPEREHTSPRKAEQKEELDTVRAALRSVNHEDVLTNGQRKKELAKIVPLGRWMEGHASVASQLSGPQLRLYKAVIFMVPRVMPFSISNI
ncbi:unnamed protein product [Lota lota]